LDWDSDWSSEASLSVTALTGTGESEEYNFESLKRKVETYTASIMPRRKLRSAAI